MPNITVSADIKNHREMYLHRKNDGILLLPVGCFEMHGPHAGMSCDTFIAEAACRVMAESWGNALVLPPVHYAYPGATAPWGATADISPETTCAYLKAVVISLMKKGFRRLVIVNIHFPNRPNLQQVVRSVFRDTGHIPVLLDVDYGGFNARVTREWDHPYGEALMMYAALHILGRAHEWDPDAGVPDETLPGPGWPSESTWDLKKCGAEFGYCFGAPENHVGKYPGLAPADAERGAAVFRETVMAKIRDLPAAYDRYLQDAKELMNARPWAE